MECTTIKTRTSFFKSCFEHRVVSGWSGAMANISSSNSFYMRMRMHN